jgi:hypothetical protein
MRALVWFAAGVGAVLAALVAGYVALITYAIGQWDREPRHDDDYSRYSTPEQLQRRVHAVTDALWRGTYGERAL